MKDAVKLALAGCFFHADNKRPVFKGKTLIYLEQSMADWLMRNGAMTFMVPPPSHGFTVKDYVDLMDGLVLQGGSDLSPKSYGETPIMPEWNGDYVRDQYEIMFVEEFIRQGKPVLGICRGAQLINVAMGGTMFQDIATQCKNAIIHRDWNVYDRLSHGINFEEGSWLRKWFSGKSSAKVNSVHHQAIKTLGKNLKVDAVSESDGIIEAIRYDGDGPFVYGVQWHPEFQHPNDFSLLDPTPMINEFINAAKVRRNA